MDQQRSKLGGEYSRHQSRNINQGIISLKDYTIVELKNGWIVSMREMQSQKLTKARHLNRYPYFRPLEY